MYFPNDTGLSLGQLPSNATECVYPDLYPTHAWIPYMSYNFIPGEGHRLYDLVGNWHTNYCSPSDGTNSTYDKSTLTYFTTTSSGAPHIECRLSEPINVAAHTLVWVVKPRDGSSGMLHGFSISNTLSDIHSTFYTTQHEYTNDTEHNTLDGEFSLDEWHFVAVSVDDLGNRHLVVNGHVFSDILQLPVTMTGINTISFGARVINGDIDGSYCRTRAAYFYDHALTVEQMQLLYTDYLAPFRSIDTHLMLLTGLTDFGDVYNITDETTGHEQEYDQHQIYPSYKYEVEEIVTNPYHAYERDPASRTTYRNTYYLHKMQECADETERICDVSLVYDVPYSDTTEYLGDVTTIQYWRGMVQTILSVGEDLAKINKDGSYDSTNTVANLESMIQHHMKVENILIWVQSGFVLDNEIRDYFRQLYREMRRVFLKIKRFKTNLRAS